MISQKKEEEQFFIEDREILKKIVKFGEVGKNEVILEIGAGKGLLTEELAKKAKKVYAIEKDEELYKFLKKKFEGNEKVEILNANALKIRFPKFDKCISNLPYSIAEPLLRKLLYYDFKFCLFLLPEKFCKRILKLEREEGFSLLSLFTQLFYNIEIKMKVEKEKFIPYAKSDAFLIKLWKKESKEIKEEILKELFRQRDKKLKNALREGLIRAFEKFGKKLTKNQARGIIKRLGLETLLLEKKVSEFCLDEFLEVKERIYAELKL